MSLIEHPELSEAEQEGLIAQARHTRRFSFMGNRVLIRGNDPMPLDRFTAVYDAFQAPAEAPGSDLEICYELAEEGAGRRLTLLSDDRTYRIRDPEFIEWSFGLFTFLILQRIDSHYLVHAGSLNRRGHALVISGDSGMGKSTLVSHLVARGLGFLSDELAPIERNTGWVEPFPRRLCLRPGPADSLLGGNMEIIDFCTREDFRRMVAIDHLSGQPAAGRVPLHSVLFLSTLPEGEVRTPMKFDRRIRIAFTACPDAFDRDLRALPGVAVLDAERDREFPAFLLETGQPDRLLPAVKDLCDRHRVELAELNYDRLAAPDYTAAPRLVRIPSAAGVVELLKKVPGSQKRRLVDHVFGGRFASLVEELAGTVKNARFYRLSPGRLEDMIRIVEELPE
jgi:hypothetical protein